MYVWSYCWDDGDIYLDGKVVTTGNKEGYVLLGSTNEGWKVLKYFGTDTVKHTVTCGDDGIILLGAFKGAYLAGQRRGTYIIEAPVDVLSYVTCGELRIDCDAIVDYCVLNMQKNSVIATHLQRIEDTLIGFDGLTTPAKDVPVVGSGDILLVSHKGFSVIESSPAQVITGEWNGKGFSVPNTKVTIQLVGKEEGDTFIVPVPERLLGAKKPVTYYPYGPEGETCVEGDAKEATSTESTDNDSLASRISMEMSLVLDMLAGNEYASLVEEVFKGAPDYFVNSQQPLKSALLWCITERKGRL